jgi:site-specific recombinase XerD
MPLTLDEALGKHEEYARSRGHTDSSIGHTRNCVTMLARFLPAGRDAADITVKDYRRFVADLRQRPQRRTAKAGITRSLSATSVKTYARAVRALFSWMGRDGVIPANPLLSEAAPKTPRKLPLAGTITSTHSLTLNFQDEMNVILI